MGRPKAEVDTQPREVSRLRERLDEWRKSRDRGKAFPEEFWVSAGRLALRHGVHATARALGLEYNKLKRASGGTTDRGGRKEKSAVAKPVKFVELTGTLAGSPSGARLSLYGPGGQRLQLEMSPGTAAEVVLQLWRSGWGAS
jgi:hypothetical protein